MVQLKAMFAQMGDLFTNLFEHPDWRNLVDIVILAILVYQVIKLLMNTRANSLFKGLLALLALAWVSDIFEIHALNWLMQQVLSWGIIVVVVVFQPEMRRALDRIGNSKLSRRVFSSGRLPQSGRQSQSGKSAQSGKQKNKVREDGRIQEIMNAVFTMSKKRIGALIVFERKTSLGDVIDTGTIVDAEISDALIQNIFEPNTPLHDGASIIRLGRIHASACILPLSEDYTISKALGTRHRAGIGITEATDAISLIVSEETGIVSMARGGQLTRGLDEQSLRILLTELFDSNEAPLFSFKNFLEGGDGE